MKKNKKIIRYNYDKLSDKYKYEDYLHKEYYGLFIKNGRLKIDTKRLLLKLENTFDKRCDFRRNTVYFTPFKIHKYDYCMNYFIDAIEKARTTWYEQKNSFHQMLDDYAKKEYAKEVPNWDFSRDCGILEPDEWEMSNRMESYLHYEKIRQNITDRALYLMNTLYLETIQQVASHLEHAMIFTMQKYGYEGDKCGRLDIFKFMDGRIGKSEAKIKALPHFDDYDKFYSIWNFTKHNSPSTYNKLKNKWPELLYSKEIDKWFDLEFPSEHLAIEYLKLNDKIITAMFDPLLEFYYEFCELCYGEPKYHSSWNYDDYFLSIVNAKIKDDRDILENPLGLPWWL